MSPELENEMRLRISERVVGENADDILEMIRIFANERTKARNAPGVLPPTDSETDRDAIVSGGLLCILFEFVKWDDYQSQAVSFRRNFRGIQEDQRKQEIFRRSIRPEALVIDNVAEAQIYGFHNLFRISIV